MTEAEGLSPGGWTSESKLSQGRLPLSAVEESGFHAGPPAASGLWAVCGNPRLLFLHPDLCPSP